MPRGFGRPAESGASPPEKTICPSPEELSVINNDVRCERCGLVFGNEPRYRLHDLKVHQRKKLDKTAKENARYHCPVESCVYAVTSHRYFSTVKYLKQHYLKVHAEKRYACDRCGKSFSTESAKNGHARVCGVDFACSCSKTYVTYEALLTHAKRSLHAVTEKYKNSRRTDAETARIVSPRGRASKPVAILPNPDKSGKNGKDTDVATKSTSDVGVQTDDCKRSGKKMSNPSKFNDDDPRDAKRRTSKQTQTANLSEEKTSGKSMETQTPRANSKDSSKMRKRGGRCRRALSKRSERTLLKEELDLGDTFASGTLFPASPLPLRHDVGLQDFWEEKNTSSTQTIPEKDMFEAFDDNVTRTEFETFYSRRGHNPLIRGVPKSTVALMTLPYVEDASAVEGYSFASTDGMSRADPMLTAKTFDDRFSSIETQTEQAFSPSYFYSDALSRSFALSSNIETQTTDDLDNAEQLPYSDTYTQTCDKMLSSDLGLSDIQTQTAWSRDDATVSTETRTKSPICETDCNVPTGACRSWLNTQTSHTETQTDLFNIFEGFG
ncbi:ASCIZ zinc finger protein [Temnothorax americanus]|uniref:ASCIZ zinc finger protein n=1 Tax=Temnothorax americanus TaxID=1964332 RepID=UPI004068D363